MKAERSVCILRAVFGWLVGNGDGVNRTTGRALSRGFMSFIFSFMVMGGSFWLMNRAGNDAYSQRASNTDTFFKQSKAGKSRTDEVLLSSWRHYTSLCSFWLLL